MTSFVNKPKPGMARFTAELNGQIIHFYSFAADKGEFAFKYFKPSMKNRDNLKVKIYEEPKEE